MLLTKKTCRLSGIGNVATGIKNKSNWKTDSSCISRRCLSKMADNEESRVLRDEVKSNSLLKAILPIDLILETQNNMMATYFSQSPYWNSMLIVGQTQVQRNGLLFQASVKFYK
jgi:hypothetical protein